MLKHVFLSALVVLSLAPGAEARHRNHRSDAAPGEFDYYLLSLSWSPAFCLSSPDAAECNGPRRFGFIVHGLWPQNEQGWPEHCGNSEVPDGVVAGIADLMPARGLVYHEWSAHGTCSGLEPADFFALVRKAYTSVAVAATFAAPGGAVNQSPAAITTEFLRANPRFPAQSVIVTCNGQDAARLREVHVCFTRDLSPRACSADAARAACTASSVIVPPIR